MPLALGWVNVGPCAQTTARASGGSVSGLPHPFLTGGLLRPAVTAIRHRLTALAGAFALLTLFLVGLVVAQVPSQAPVFNLRIAATPPNGVITKSLGSIEFTFQVSFQYDASNPAAGQFLIDVTAEKVVTVFPEGWSVSSLSATQFQMRPSETKSVTVGAALQTDRPAADSIEIEVRFHSRPYFASPGGLPAAPGLPAQLAQEDTDSAKVTAEKRLTAGETVTGFFRDYALWFGGVAIALFVLGVVLAKRRNQPGGRLTLSCANPEQEVAPGRGASFSLRIENQSSEAEQVRLDVHGVPAGWKAILPLRELELGRDQSTQVWLTLQAPDGAAAGESATADVTVAPKRYPDRRTRLTVRAFVGGESGESADVEEEPPRVPARGRRRA